MSPITTKRRNYTPSSEIGVYKTYVGSSLISTDLYEVKDVVYQKTISQGNPYGRISNSRSHRHGTEDIGGSFLTSKVEVYSYPRRHFSFSSGSATAPHWTYEGTATAYARLPLVSESDFLTASSDSQMDSYGTTAIARCIPTNPLSGMGQFLGELRDLPKVPDIRKWRDRLQNIRKAAKRVNYDRLSRDAAGEYLNQVFGWVPFVSDVRKFIDVIRDAGPQMVKYARGSGRLIHRTYTFPVESTTTTSVVSSNSYPSPSLTVREWTKSGVLTKTETTVTSRYFKGAFTYYLPPGNPNLGGLGGFITKARYFESFANKLFGLRLTPDLIWKLTPWSWAEDWVVNTGDVIHNWSSFSNDGLVMRYGYIMETKVRVVEYSLVGVGCSAGTQDFRQTFTYTTKKRRRATPYGFGANPASFSAKQWGVIAALGISKQPLSLNF